jgi:hypothetical protein
MWIKKTGNIEGTRLIHTTTARGTRKGGGGIAISLIFSVLCAS